MMAPRRSAARSARLEAGLGDGFEEAGRADALAPARRLAGFVVDFLAVLVGSFVMFTI